MPDDTALALAKFRIEQARECLRSAELESEEGIYRAAANRSYYCIFHAMRAVLALEKFDSKKHSGIISAFRKKYIKTKIFPELLSDYIRDAFDVRSNSDYEDFFIISKNDIEEQVNNARSFLESIESYISNTNK